MVECSWLCRGLGSLHSRYLVQSLGFGFGVLSQGRFCPLDQNVFLKS